MKKQFGFLILVLVSTLSFAEEANESTTTAEAPKVASVPRPKSTVAATAGVPQNTGGESVAALPPNSDSKIYGLLDLRPSVSTKSGVMGSENTAEAGYQFNSNARLTFTQWWNTSKNLSEGLYTHDGFFRLRLNNIVNEGNFSLNYQARLFLPTFASRRDAGFVAGFYNGLTASYKLSSVYTLSLATAPQFNYYTRAAHAGKATPGFQNVAMANLNVQFTSRLYLSFPLYMISTRMNNAPGAANSDSWSHLLVVWPELGYSLNSNHTIGLSYYSDGLMNSTLSKFTLNSGISNGVLQAFWTITI